MSSLRLSPADKSSQSAENHSVPQSLLHSLTERFVDPPGILTLFFFKLVLKHKCVSLYCYGEVDYSILLKN